MEKEKLEFPKGLLERADLYAVRQLPEPATLPKDGKKRESLLADLKKDRATIAAEAAPRMQALADKSAPLPAGNYRIQPPPYGCRHPFLGELKPGTKSFDKKLSSAQATALRARDQPFGITSLEE